MRNSSKNSERKRVTVWDFVLMAALTVAATGTVLLRSGGSDEALEVVVKKDSSIVYTANLSEISEGSEIEIDDEYHIILKVMSDGVQVISSDCGDKVCVNTGKITKSGQAVVCLPAHVSVALKGGEASDIDVMVG